MIKLCYKSYEWKASNGACKSFKDQTGKDLLGLFSKYIVASINMREDTSIFERTEILRDIASREDACKALYCLINAAQDGISLTEIEDATARVGWTVSDRPDDLSEPWPVEMLNIAMKINSYMCDNMPKKKADMSDD